MKKCIFRIDYNPATNEAKAVSNTSHIGKEPAESNFIFGMILAHTLGETIRVTAKAGKQEKVLEQYIEIIRSAALGDEEDELF